MLSTERLPFLVNGRFRDARCNFEFTAAGIDCVQSGKTVLVDYIAYEKSTSDKVQYSTSANQGMNPLPLGQSSYAVVGEAPSNAISFRIAIDAHDVGIKVCTQPLLFSGGHLTLDRAGKVEFFIEPNAPLPPERPFFVSLDFEVLSAYRYANAEYDDDSGEGRRPLKEGFMDLKIIGVLRLYLAAGDCDRMRLSWNWAG